MKQNTPKEQQRIYIILAKTVQVEFNGQLLKSVEQTCGRVMAQAGHASDLLRDSLNREYFRKHRKFPEPEVFTRICLAARDSNEMEHVKGLLSIAGINFVCFYDTNEFVYGMDGNGNLFSPMTAIAVEPIEPSRTKGIIDYLPLWKHDETVR